MIIKFQMFIINFLIYKNRNNKICSAEESSSVHLN